MPENKGHRSAADWLPVGGGARRTNCAAPERAGTEHRRQLRHFIAEPEKRPANRTVAGQTDRHIRKRVRPVFTGRTLRRTAATYSPTWSGSTIGDDGLSFSVRNGKRRFPVAIATAVYNLRENQRKKSSRLIFPERKISGY